MMISVKQISFNTKEYFQTLGLRYEVLRRPLSLHYHVNDLVKESGDLHVAAFKGSRIVGCLIVSKLELSENHLKMRQVAVDQHFQGTGIGKSMVQFSENWAIQNGYEKFVLHARNTAVPFYLSLGYTIEGNEFLEVNIPHLKMIKYLK